MSKEAVKPEAAAADPYGPVSAENEATLLNTDLLGKTIAEAPQPFDLNAFEDLQAKKDGEAEAEAKAGPKSTKPEDSPLDRLFVLSLDTAQATVCGLISGEGNKDDKFSLSEKRRIDLIQASEAAGLGEKYVSMFGPETMFWLLFTGSVAPNLQKAAEIRKQNAAKAAKAKSKPVEPPAGISGLEAMQEAEKQESKGKA